MRNFIGFNSLGEKCRHLRINGPSSKPVNNIKTSAMEVSNIFYELIIV